MEMKLIYTLTMLLNVIKQGRKTQLFQAVYPKPLVNQHKPKGTQKFPSFMKYVSYQPYIEVQNN